MAHYHNPAEWLSNTTRPKGSPTRTRRRTHLSFADLHHSSHPERDVMCEATSLENMYESRERATYMNPPYTDQRPGEYERIEHVFVRFQRGRLVMIAVTIWLCGCSTRKVYPFETADDPDTRTPCSTQCTMLCQTTVPTLSTVQ